MPDGDFRLEMRSSTALGVAEAVMRPAVIVAEAIADVVRGALYGIAYLARGLGRLLCALVKPALYTVAAAALLATGAAGGYGYRTLQILAAKPVQTANSLPLPPQAAPDLPETAPPQGDASRPFGPRVTPPPADPFGMH